VVLPSPIIGNSIIKCKVCMVLPKLHTEIHGSEILDQLYQRLRNKGLPSPSNPYSTSYWIHKNLHDWQILKDCLYNSRARTITVFEDNSNPLANDIFP
jgi:hypothetical protein